MYYKPDIFFTFSQSVLTWFSLSCLHSFSCSTHWSSSLVNVLSSITGSDAAVILAESPVIKRALRWADAKHNHRTPPLNSDISSLNTKRRVTGVFHLHLVVTDRCLLTVSAVCRRWIFRWLAALPTFLMNALLCNGRCSRRPWRHWNGTLPSALREVLPPAARKTTNNSQMMPRIFSLLINEGQYTLISYSVHAVYNQSVRNTRHHMHLCA